MGVIFVVAARAKVSSLRVGLPWTYGLQSKLPSTTGRSARVPQSVGQLNFGIDAGKDFGCHPLLKSIS